jgi:hypothetical protein
VFCESPAQLLLSVLLTPIKVALDDLYFWHVLAELYPRL